MDNLHIKGPRQQRAVAALLKGPIAVKDLGLRIGALNPRQVISELRRQGFDRIILTRRYTTIDQDGRQCRPGEYYIHGKSKPIVENALRNHILQIYSKSNEGTKSPDSLDNNREE